MVDLPEPVSPTIPNVSPSEISKLISSTALKILVFSQGNRNELLDR